MRPVVNSMKYVFFLPKWSSAEWRVSKIVSTVDPLWWYCNGSLRQGLIFIITNPSRPFIHTDISATCRYLFRHVTLLSMGTRVLLTRWKSWILVLRDWRCPQNSCLFVHACFKNTGSCTIEDGHFLRVHLGRCIDVSLSNWSDKPLSWSRSDATLMH